MKKIEGEAISETMDFRMKEIGQICLLFHAKRKTQQS
jgi:hypothetical protein